MGLQRQLIRRLHVQKVCMYREYVCMFLIYLSICLFFELDFRSTHFSKARLLSGVERCCISLLILAGQRRLSTCAKCGRAPCTLAQRCEWRSLRRSLSSSRWGLSLRRTGQSFSALEPMSDQEGQPSDQEGQQLDKLSCNWSQWIEKLDVAVAAANLPQRVGVLDKFR